LTIKEPLDVDSTEFVDNILYKVMDSIEQSKKFEWRNSMEQLSN